MLWKKINMVPMQTFFAVFLCLVSSQAYAVHLTLSVGWNLVSFNGIPNEQDISEIMTNYGSLDSSVILEIQNQTESYRASRENRATLTRISPHSSYYIYSSLGDVDLYIDTTPVSPVYGVLNVGWNMFAVGEYMTPSQLVDKLTNAGNNVIEIQDETRSYNVNRPFQATLSEISPDVGYWVKVSTESMAAGMHDAKAVIASEAQVSSIHSPDNTTLAVLVPAIETSIGTSRVESGGNVYEIPTLPVAVYAKSYVDNDVSMMVDSAYSGKQIVLQLTDNINGDVLYLNISELDEAGGVNSLGNEDDSGQAGVFE